MALEITQTLSTIKCVAFGTGSRGDGYSARILSDNDNQEFKLSYLYHAKREVPSSVPGDEHEGVAILTLIEGEKRHLKGRYFNDRDPSPKKGDIDLEWKSLNLIGKLK